MKPIALGATTRSTLENALNASPQTQALLAAYLEGAGVSLDVAWRVELREVVLVPGRVTEQGQFLPITTDEQGEPTGSPDGPQK